ncbi:Cytochrome P450 86A2 [Phytophthora citrophthora]|uniref:Cytochrome P450 86A2 n=1 Tax=Phytophthora citrophthora TaxID=4793 RepID=A0AAD9GZJ6_9STRA|nr:Cytochrome P450 86A2 [Phytophthora citrophthora]
MWGLERHANHQKALLIGTAFVVGMLGWRTLKYTLRSPAQKAADESFQRIHRPESTLPLLGNTLDAMFSQTERFVDWMADQSTLAGGKPWLMSIIGQPPMFVISSPESYEDLFKTQRHIFERGATMSYIFKDFLGEGIIAVDGHKWSQQRKSASHLFSNRMMRGIMSDEVRDKCIKLRDLLDLCAQEGKTVSMKSLISKFTSDVFTKIGFGVELHGLDASKMDLEQEHPFIQAIDDMSRLLQLRCQQPMFLWRLKRWLNVAEEREGKKNMAKITSIVNDVVMKSLSNREASTLATTEEPVLENPKMKTDNLLTFFMQSGLTDPQQLQEMAVNFFFAGKDTSSFVLSWFVVMMNRYPEVLRRIREEIREQLPELLTGEIDVPSMEQLAQLPYLEAAMRENLRLNTSMTTRSPNQDTTLSCGTFIPKDSIVYVCHYASARLKSTWGEDAAEYKPERWIDPETRTLRQFSPFKFVTFIAGPRQCIGMRFAMLELRMIAAVLFSRFDIKTVDSPFDLTYELSTVFPVKGRLLCTVQLAKTTTA